MDAICDRRIYVPNAIRAPASIYTAFGRGFGNSICIDVHVGVCRKGDGCRYGRSDADNPYPLIRCASQCSRVGFWGSLRCRNLSHSGRISKGLAVVVGRVFSMSSDAPGWRSALGNAGANGGLGWFRHCGDCRVVAGIESQAGGPHPLWRGFAMCAAGDAFWSGRAASRLWRRSSFTDSVRLLRVPRSPRRSSAPPSGSSFQLPASITSVVDAPERINHGRQPDPSRMPRSPAVRELGALGLFVQVAELDEKIAELAAKPGEKVSMVNAFDEMALDVRWTVSAFRPGRGGDEEYRSPAIRSTGSVQRHRVLPLLRQSSAPPCGWSSSCRPA